MPPKTSCPPLTAADAERIREVGVICLGGIGDVLFTLPMLAALRERFPHWRWTYIVREKPAAEFLRATGVVDAVEYMALSSRNPLRSLAAIWRLRRRYRFDLGISGVYSNPLTNSWLLRLLGAPLRVGDVSRPSRHGFTHWHAVAPDTHEITGNLRLLEHFDVAPPAIRLQYPLPSGARAFADAFLEQQGLRERFRVGIHVGPNDPDKWYRFWPVERYIEVMRRLHAAHDVAFILTGGPAELPAAERVLRESGVPAVSMVNRTSFEELLGLLSTLHVYAGNDSGPLHLASNFGYPLIALFGPTRYRRTGVWGEQVTLLRHDLPCSPCYSHETGTGGCPELTCWQKISVEEVVSAIARHIPPNLRREK